MVEDKNIVSQKMPSAPAVSDEPPLQDRASNTTTAVPAVQHMVPELLQRIVKAKSQVVTTVNSPGFQNALRTARRVSQALSQLEKINATQAIRTPSDFGQMLKAVRKKQKLSQQEFADLAGVGRRFVSECEAGKPRLEFAKVLQVAAAAGVELYATKR